MASKDVPICFTSFVSVPVGDDVLTTAITVSYACGTAVSAALFEPQWVPHCRHGRMLHPRRQEAVPPADGGDLPWGLRVGTRSRMQANKALYTCMSWYAYAAIFGSSFRILISSKSGILHVQSVKLDLSFTFT